MKLGQKVTRTPQTFSEVLSHKQSDAQHKPMSGRVVYIHPQGRYHVVEFQTPLGVIRESFSGVPE